MGEVRNIWSSGDSEINKTSRALPCLLPHLLQHLKQLALQCRFIGNVHLSP
jgi:hypothetical protein